MNDRHLEKGKMKFLNCSSSTSFQSSLVNEREIIHNSSSETVIKAPLPHTAILSLVSQK